MTRCLDTVKLSEHFRNLGVDRVARKVRVTNFTGSKQAQDFTVPANCSGFGRVRHFRRRTSDGWPSNPLPIDPACRFLGLLPTDALRAQVFQNAVCNWRCWYCFVDFELLAAHPDHSSWRTAAELVDSYLAEADRPAVLDLTGGQPDLTPEWVPWMLEELRARGLERSVYVWSDDNLSTDYFWRHLSSAERTIVVESKNYGRVGCFKGFDEDSFCFNTRADSSLFADQFKFMSRLIASGLDVYAYATFTTTDDKNIGRRMESFVTRLQEIHPYLPLRTIPLEVGVFAPVKGRMTPDKDAALRNQQDAIAAWCRELETRFSSIERGRVIVDVPLERT